MTLTLTIIFILIELCSTIEKSPSKINKKSRQTQDSYVNGVIKFLHSKLLRLN